MADGQTMRVGVIGRGFGAGVVAPAFEGTDGCEVVDVVSPRDEGAVRSLCARSDVDLVTVHSPPFLHLDHVRWAVEGGHAVLCDKPMGRSAAEASEMLDLATAAGVVHLTNFQLRWHPVRQRLRALMVEGAVGPIEHFQWNLFVAGGRGPRLPYGWLFDRELGGGLLGASGSHAIDFALWALGPAERVSGEVRTGVVERLDPEGRTQRCTADDGYTAVLRLESGATAVLDSSLVAPVNLPQVVTAIGTEAILEATGDERIVRRTSEGTHDEFVYDHDGVLSYVLAMQRFAQSVRDAVRSGEVDADLPTFVDGLAVARVMDQIRG